MFKIRKSFDAKLEKKYAKQFKKYGATPEGSYWLGSNRQNLRFKILLQEIAKLQDHWELSLGDIGCGYGALAQYISDEYSSKDLRYYGYDISKDLINFCQKNYSLSGAKFNIGTKPHLEVDICLMSGTFNLTATKNLTEWEDYIFKILTDCWLKTKKALIFNLQTSNPAYISEGNIFYADKRSVSSRCSLLFGPTSLVHHTDLPHDTTFVVQRN